jgi:hypothetical protein
MNSFVWRGARRRHGGPCNDEQRRATKKGATNFRQFNVTGYCFLTSSEDCRRAAAMQAARSPHLRPLRVRPYFDGINTGTST